jgi:transcriptional regulator with AAA-type ATPase domain
MYRPFDEAAELVRCFGEAALTVTDSAQAEITIRSPAAPADLRVSLGEGQRKARSSRSPRRARFPILYQQAEWGCLVISSPSLLPGDAGAQACEWIAQTLAYHLKRYEVGRLARERHGREASLIGTSEPLSRVDLFLERASQTSLPALILGAPGSEAERIALALHLAGPAREGVFVQASCAMLEGHSFERQLLDLLRSADGGTLLLARLEQMDLRSQHLLGEVLETGPALWTAGRCDQPVAIRLLATASLEIDEMTRRGELCAGLIEQLDYLRLELEPLRHRREDIPPLVQYFLRRHACGAVPEISDEVLQACVEYDWPGDVAELSRVVARLAVMTAGDRVLPQHVRAHAPQILGDRTVVQGSPAASLPAAEVSHPTLQRAIDYIAGHPQARLSLSQVAARAYVSSFHLSHLFHQEMGTTFTRFLTSLRVDRAKHLLLEQPRESITTIAAEAGFSDLRHFERTFKGVVGCTPREFRRLAGASRQH